MKRWLGRKLITLGLWLHGLSVNRGVWVDGVEPHAIGHKWEHWYDDTIRLPIHRSYQ